MFDWWRGRNRRWDFDDGNGGMMGEKSGGGGCGIGCWDWLGCLWIDRCYSVSGVDLRV